MPEGARTHLQAGSIRPRHFRPRQSPFRLAPYEMRPQDAPTYLPRRRKKPDYWQRLTLSVPGERLRCCRTPSTVMNSRRQMKAVIWSLQLEGLQPER